MDFIMTTKTLNDYLFDRACTDLNIFVIHHAEYVAKQIGFGYVDSNDAPNSFTSLQEAYKNSLQTNAPLPVFRGASDTSVYTCGGNWAFRFWHDVLHVTMGADFTMVGENKVAEAQAKVIADRFGRDSLQYKIFMADVMGQVVYYNIHKKYVTNQKEFVKMFIQEY